MKSNTQFRKIEYLFLFIVVLISTFVISKYLLFALSGNDIQYLLETLSVSTRNKYSTSINNNRNDFVDNGVYNLIRDQNTNEWKLEYLEGDHVPIKLDTSSDKLIFRIESPDYKTNYIIKIDNFNDYNSRNGLIKSEIPTHITEEKVEIPVQEDYFPIFGYHNIFNSEDEIVDPRIDMRVSDFVAQITYLNKKLNCNWLTLNQVVESYIIPEIKLPNNTCVITFDDGRENNTKVVLPLLKQEHINATFFIISGRLGQPSYMNAWEVGTLFKEGMDIQSHSYTGGSLIYTDWYLGDFTHNTLIQQISGSKSRLEELGFKVSLFAYPLGDYNDELISVVKESGYLGARSTKKHNIWRDPRALATSMESDFIWHLNYYEPVLKLTEEISNEVGYSGYWQFEEGYRTISSSDTSKLRILSENPPSSKSFGVIELTGQDIGIENSFLLSNDGEYKLSISAKLEDSESYEIKIDDQLLTNTIREKCSSEQFCLYTFTVILNKGKHKIAINSYQGKNLLDKFNLVRLVPVENVYRVSVISK